MLKRDELRRPGSCLNKAAPDELVFVLRAKDPLAAQVVRLWAAMADGCHEPDKITEALETAEAMDQWRVGPAPAPSLAKSCNDKVLSGYGEAVRDKAARMSADRGY